MPFQNAKWISVPRRMQQDLNGPMPYIRKTFQIKEKPIQATLSFCAVGYGVCNINGQPVTNDVLTTPLSNYDISVYYNTYDVTSLLLAGSNAIGIIPGNGWYNDPCTTWNFQSAPWRGYPRIIAELSVTYADGTEETVNSDTSWKTALGPILFNHARSGEDYDARLEIDGWDLLSFSDDTWSNAIQEFGTGGILKPASLPPIRRIRTVPATKRGNGVYDLGENISGWVRFSVRGKRGDKVTVVYAEMLHDDGTLDNGQENELNKSLNRIHSDTYILKGNDIETWEPMFTWHGFQYFTIETEAEILSAEGILAHTDLQAVGDFSCSDETLNKLHRASVRAVKTNFFSIPTDCPTREQMGWTGDSCISAEQALMNFDMDAAYAHWISLIADVQRPNGQLACIVPTPPYQYAWEGGPEWDSAFILIPYYLYRTTGNRKPIETYFDAFVRYLDFLETTEEDGTVKFNLGDWNPPPGRKRCDSRLTSTCYYHTVAKTVAYCAELLDKDPTPYLETANRVRNGYRKHILHGEFPALQTQTGIACSLYHGMYDSDEIPAAVEELVRYIHEKDDHFDTGILGTKAMFTVLTENGHIDLLYKMITNPTMPSYAYWMDQGMTSLCERWNLDKSKNHHMFSEIDFWFYKYLAGIRLSQEALIIQPYFPKELKWVKCHHREISVAWDEKTITVSVPRNATLILNGNRYPLPVGTHTFRKDI